MCAYVCLETNVVFCREEKKKTEERERGKSGRIRERGRWRENAEQKD